LHRNKTSVTFVDLFENSCDGDARDGKDETRTGLQQFHLGHKTLQTFWSETEKEHVLGIMKCMNIRWQSVCVTRWHRYVLCSK